MIAQASPGEPEQISQHLLDLIQSTMKDMEGKFNVPVSNHKFFKHDAVIEWFSSATLDPVVLGTTSGRYGACIGLPHYLNYQTAEELPRSLFEFKKVRLFKLSDKPKKGDGKQSESTDLEEERDGATYIARRIDRDSLEGQEYASSLILSDKAKKFVISRELYLSETVRPFVESLTMAFFLMGATALGRYPVAKHRLMDTHVSKRMFIYTLSAILTYSLYGMFSDLINSYFLTETDKLAVKVAPEYFDGAEEYFEKTLKRNLLLSVLSPETAAFDEFGNYLNSPLRRKYFPFTDRLKKIRELKDKLSAEEEESKASAEK